MNRHASGAHVPKSNQPTAPSLTTAAKASMAPYQPECHNRVRQSRVYDSPTRQVMILGSFLSASGGSRGVCEEMTDRLRARGWEVRTASSRPSRIMRFADMTWRVMRDGRRVGVAQVDVFSGNAFLFSEWTCSLLRRLGTPYVLTLHGGNLPDFGRRWPERLRRLMRSAAVVTAPSRYLQERLDFLGVPMRCIPNPIDLAQYQFRVRDVPAPRCVWLRALHAIYNPCLAARAVAELLGAHPMLELSVFGPDKGDGSLERLRSEIARLRLDARVRIEGAVKKSEVPAAMSRGDIFLNTSDIDNMPVSVVEAMACGLCVVSTNVGGMPYLIENGETGLLVPPGDPHAMAIAISRVLQDRELASRMSTRARAAVERFDWGLVLPEWEQLFRSTAAGVPSM